MPNSTALLRPDRVRRIDGSFTFIPSRFLHGGFLATLSHAEATLYLFLLLASNRQGVSRYHYDRICMTTGMNGDTYIHARDGLIAKDLLAFDGSRYQLLALPPCPVPPAPPPLTQSHRHSASVDGDARDRIRSLQSVRDILAGLAE